MNTLERLKRYLENTSIKEFNNELNKLDDDFFKGPTINEIHQQLQAKYPDQAYYFSNDALNNADFSNADDLSLASAA